MKVISVFGSNRPVPGDKDYQDAHDLGAFLAQAGYAVATGGYMGSMEAVSQGAASAGGHVIGVTCDEIESWRNAKPNPYLTEEIRYHTLWERLVHVVTHNNGIIALPGGIGTLTEVMLAWSQLQIDVLAPRPFILLGDFWQRAMNAMVNPAYISADHISFLKHAKSPEAAVALLQDYD
ncbi:MAG: LOG family protein [Chloroflexota bacterium]